MDRIQKTNYNKNKLKLRRMEKVSNDLLCDISEKNEIIDDQSEEIERQQILIRNYEQELMEHSKKKTSSNDDFMTTATNNYIILIFVLALLKFFLQWKRRMTDIGRKITKNTYFKNGFKLPFLLLSVIQT